ncbi:MAG: hypothetical protein AAGD06_12710 [Acidobacteriota bacterium]
MATPSQGHRPDDLPQRLRRADRRGLRLLVEEHGRQLTLGDVRQILLNPFVDGEVIEELSFIRSLVSKIEVRRALARHRRTPEPVAMRFVANLFWRDLMEITADTRLRAPVRRLAERYLLQRLPRLTTGEKISLARRATPETAGRLLLDPNPRVVRAVLGNPRLTEERLLLLVSHPEAEPRILHLVSEDPRWGPRYSVSLALARNPRSPFRTVFAILPRLRRRDLESVAVQASHSSVVRHRAQDHLDARPVPETTGVGRDADSPIAVQLIDNRGEFNA